MLEPKAIYAHDIQHVKHQLFQLKQLSDSLRGTGEKNERRGLREKAQFHSNIYSIDQDKEHQFCFLLYLIQYKNPCSITATMKCIQSFNVPGEEVEEEQWSLNSQPAEKRDQYI